MSGGTPTGRFPSPPRPLSSCAADWSSADVVTWVSEVLHLPQYAQTFEAQQIDGPTLLELPEDLLDTHLLVHNPIHRKKIVAHVKLLSIALAPPRCPPQRGRRAMERGPGRSASSSPNSASRALDEQDDCEDFLSSGGAASLQRSSTGGASSNLASGRLRSRKELSQGSSSFSSGKGTALAERAAARRGRSLDRLAALQQSQALRRCPSHGTESSLTPRLRPESSYNSAMMSARGSSMGGNTMRSSGSQRIGCGPADGKVMILRGKRVDAWGELGPSHSRKGSFGGFVKNSREASRDTGPLPDPLGPVSDASPVSSFYYKASFEKGSTRSAVMGSAPRKLLSDIGQKSCSPGPAYRPRVEWKKLQVGGTIGRAQRLRYDRPNCHHWLSEVQD